MCVQVALRLLPAQLPKAWVCTAHAQCPRHEDRGEKACWDPQHRHPRPSPLVQGVRGLRSARERARRKARQPEVEVLTSAGAREEEA